MADTLLRGTRLLLAGAEVGAASAVRTALEAAGAEVVAVEGDAVAQVLAGQVDAVVALGDAAEPLRRALDPLGSDGGPALIAVGVAVAACEGGPELVVGLVDAALRGQKLRDRATSLEATVLETTMQQTRQLELTRLETLRRLGRIAEYRDDNSWEHTERVAQLAARIGSRLGTPRRIVGLLRRTAQLHDIGKIAIPDTILLKPGKLTSYEFEVVKTHTVVGAQVLAGGNSDLMSTAEQIVRSHHERWDGNGYPDGKVGSAIPLVARLVHVADVFDILTHERPHKEAWSMEEAAAEITRNAGTQFDPTVVQAFQALGPEVWRAPAPMREASTS